MGRASGSTVYHLDDTPAGSAGSARESGVRWEAPWLTTWISRLASCVDVEGSQRCRVLIVETPARASYSDA